MYPTVNYIQDPNEIIDYRGPDFTEPTPDMLDYLKEVALLCLFFFQVSFHSFQFFVIRLRCDDRIRYTPRFKTQSRKLKKEKYIVVCDWGAGSRVHSAL